MLGFCLQHPFFHDGRALVFHPEKLRGVVKWVKEKGMIPCDGMNCLPDDAWSRGRKRFFFMSVCICDVLIKRSGLLGKLKNELYYLFT
jgi:hypothetical protein